MIDSKELRIGNWVNEKVLGDCPVSTVLIQSAWVTSGIKKGSAVSNHIKSVNLYPIPLSPEILEKCEFVKKDGWPLIGVPDPEDDTYDRWDDVTLTKLTRGKFPNSKGEYYYYLGGRPTTNVTYLHQLQNLYYALTSNELNIEL